MINTITVPLVTKNAFNGIIYKLKNKYKLDPLIENIIALSSSKDKYGSINTLIYWNEARYGANDTPENPNPWFEISFTTSFVFPTAFSMRGVSAGNNFPASWEVFGIPEREENNENNWDLLATNNFEESTYCKIHDTCCYDGTNIGTYLLKYTSKGYKHLRWRLKTTYDNNNPFFPVTGIDIYGTLSYSKIIKKKMTIACKNPCVLSIFVLTHWICS